MRIPVTLAVFIGLAAAASKSDSFFQYPVDVEDLSIKNPAALSQAVSNYKNMSGLNYNVNMTCEGCIRTGYDFCLFRTFPDNLTHGQFTNCSQWAITPEINSVTNVNETNRWICSGAFKDQMNSIVSMCNKDINPMAKRNTAQCGPYLIDLEYSSSVFVQSLFNLTNDTSCTYRLHTKCGFPKFSWFSQTNTMGEYDIIYNTRDDLVRDDDALFSLNDTSKVSGSMPLTFDNTWNFSSINANNVLYQPADTQD